MHAISSYRDNRPTHTQTHNPSTHKQTGPITIHCAAASAQCNDAFYCNAAIALPSAAKKNPSASSLESHSHYNVKQYAPTPLLPRGRQSPRAPPSRRNVAVLCHTEYVPTLTVATALRVKAALSKAAW